MSVSIGWYLVFFFVLFCFFKRMWWASPCGQAQVSLSRIYHGIDDTQRQLLQACVSCHLCCYSNGSPSHSPIGIPIQCWVLKANQTPTTVKPKSIFILFSQIAFHYFPKHWRTTTTTTSQLSSYKKCFIFGLFYYFYL